MHAQTVRPVVVLWGRLVYYAVMVGSALLQASLVTPLLALGVWYIVAGPAVVSPVLSVLAGLGGTGPWQHPAQSLALFEDWAGLSFPGPPLALPTLAGFHLNLQLEKKYIFIIIYD